MSDIQQLTDLTTQVRRDILRMVHGVSSGHPGGSLGCAEFLVCLYNEVMDIKLPFTMDGKGEDLFFLSNGHISPVFYSVLARRGLFPVSELSTFRKLNTRLQGHPTPCEGLEGIRIASGSLGQGISAACGMALAGKIDNADYRVYSILGDGELEEGQVWEAAMFAGFYKLNNLTAFVDFNGLQIDGDITKVLSPLPIPEKFKAFNWNVIEVNGHDLDELHNAIETAKAFTEGPTCIIMHTVKGKGVEEMEGQAGWHGKAPSEEQGVAFVNEIMGVQ